MSKWLLMGGFSFIFGLAIFLILTGYKNDEGNVRAVQEVEAALQSANVGSIRDGEAPTISKKEAVANIVKQVIETQKNSGKDIQIQYVFLDSNDKKTDDDSRVTSVQFEVTLLNKDKQVQSTSTSRLKLKEVYDG